MESKLDGVGLKTCSEGLAEEEYQNAQSLNRWIMECAIRKEKTTQTRRYMSMSILDEDGHCLKRECERDERLCPDGFIGAVLRSRWTFVVIPQSTDKANPDTLSRCGEQRLVAQR